MKNFSALFLTLLLTLFPVLAAEAQSGGGNSSASISSNYRLKPSDLIEVKVFQEPDLNKQVRIEADGSIVLPLINRVNVGGLSIDEAQQKIQELYNQDFLVNPQVNLLVLEYRMRKVDVIGQVNQPGPIEIPSDKALSLVEAISQAGSFTRLARRTTVQVTRTDPDGKKQVIEINVDRMMSSEEAPDFVLQDGDIVFVPERFL